MLSRSEGQHVGRQARSSGMFSHSVDTDIFTGMTKDSLYRKDTIFTAEGTFQPKCTGKISLQRARQNLSVCCIFFRL